MNKKRLIINMLATLISFTVGMGMNFFLVPYVIDNVGEAAYGFVGLANDFVNYGLLISIALNSMAGRFIAIKLYKDEIEEAKHYFTSTFFANIFLASIMVIPAIIVIVFLEKIMDVPVDILRDVKILWSFIFINFIIGILTSVFGVVSFVKNRLDVSSKVNILSNILKAILMISIFSIFTPSVWYIGAVTCICSVFISVYNIYQSKKLMSEISIKKVYFKFKYVVELISAGVWNAIGSLNSILMTGLDLFVTNLFIDASAMGVMAFVKTIPNFLNNFSATIVSSVSPQITMDYAKEDAKDLIKKIEMYIMIITFLTSIPVGIFIVSSNKFYDLWLNGEYDSTYLQLLTILSIGTMLVAASSSIFNNIFIAANKVKVNSIVSIIAGFINIVCVFTLLKTTNLGLIIIAGTSTIIVLIKNIIFQPLYLSKILKVKWYQFYPIIFRNIYSIVLSVGVCYIIKPFFLMDNWINFILYGVASGAICIVLYIFVLLNKNEKIFLKSILHKISDKIRR